MYARNGTAYASSRDVAAFFGKQHAHVIRDIKGLISDAPSIASNFGAIEVPVKVGFGTRMDPAYEMTRDGFTLLAMGFTGKTALVSAFPFCLFILSSVQKAVPIQSSTPKPMEEGTVSR